MTLVAMCPLAGFDSRAVGGEGGGEGQGEGGERGGREGGEDCGSGCLRGDLMRRGGQGEVRVVWLARGRARLASSGGSVCNHKTNTGAIMF